MLFDSIVHSGAALRYLIEVAGAGRVVMGTDYPMAMGEFEPVTKIESLQLGARDRELILGGNAARALNCS
jgi:aminocarboxymuconate-semialdehyde decarboxylase